MPCFDSTLDSELGRISRIWVEDTCGDILGLIRKCALSLQCHGQLKAGVVFGNPYFFPVFVSCLSAAEGKRHSADCLQRHQSTYCRSGEDKRSEAIEKRERECGGLRYKIKDRERGR
jgi:hypothetical protein